MNNGNFRKKNYVCSVIKVTKNSDIILEVESKQNKRYKWSRT